MSWIHTYIHCGDWRPGTKEYLLIKEEVRKVLSKGKAAGVLRLVFHDAGTFDIDDSTGIILLSHLRDSKFLFFFNFHSPSAFLAKANGIWLSCKMKVNQLFEMVWHHHGWKSVKACSVSLFSRFPSVTSLSSTIWRSLRQISYILTAS